MAYSKIRPRRGTLYEWQTINPLLAEGELVVEVPDDGVGTGLSKFKIGDGVNHYNDLPYAFDGASASAIIGGDASNFSLIQLRAAEHNVWLGVDPVLAKNEITYDITVSGIKIGNGVDNWSKLPYLELFAEWTNYNGTGSGITDYGDEDAQSDDQILHSHLHASTVYQEATGNIDYADNILPENWRDESVTTDDDNSEVVGAAEEDIKYEGGMDTIFVEENNNNEEEMTVGLDSLF